MFLNACNQAFSLVTKKIAQFSISPINLFKYVLNRNAQGLLRAYENSVPNLSKDFLIGLGICLIGIPLALVATAVTAAISLVGLTANIAIYCVAAPIAIGMDAIQGAVAARENSYIEITSFEESSDKSDSDEIAQEIPVGSKLYKQYISLDDDEFNHIASINESDSFIDSSPFNEKNKKSCGCFSLAWNMFRPKNEQNDNKKKNLAISSPKNYISINHG